MNDTNEGARGAAAPVRRIALFADDARAFPEDVAPLVARLVAAGHRVRCFAPDWPDHVAPLATALGAETDTFPTRPTGTWRLMPGRALRKEISGLIDDWAPSVVMAIGPGCARLVLPAVRTDSARPAAGRPGAGGSRAVRRVAVLDRWAPPDAIPDVVIDPSRRLDTRTLREIAASTDAIVCHTPEDARTLAAVVEAERRGGAARSPDILPLPGFGVATARIERRDLPTTADGVIFLLTAPLDRWKGIDDYLAAARLLADTGTRARFRLQAAPGRGPDPLDLAELAGLDSVEVVDRQVGLEEAIAAAHVLVVASRNEGTPRELLAALAIGRPVIATDLSGCRAAIDEIVNGCLVPPGHAGALARACESFARRPDILPAMGRASRLKAERRFEQDGVTRGYLEALGLAR